MTKKQKIFTSLGVVVVLFVALVHLTLAAFTTTPFNISRASTDAGFPAIAVSNNAQNVGIAWAEKRSGGGAVQGPIYLKTASDGTTLTQWLTVDNAVLATDQSFSPDVAADPNTETNMHVVWANISGSSPQLYTIYYASCSTTGASCTEDPSPVDQVNTTATGKILQDPKMVTSDHGTSTAVHVVWVEVDRSSANPADHTVTIYYNGKRTNGTWTGRTEISNKTGVGSEFAVHPDIATSEDSGGNKYVHIVWASDTDKDTGQGDDTEDNEAIKYKRGTLNASGEVTTWTSAKSFSKTPSNGTSINPNYPAVAAAGDIVMVLWDDLTQAAWPNDEQYYGVNDVSVNAGGTFPSEGADPPGQIGSSAFRSDHDTSVNTADVRGSDHARRLQIKAAASLTSTSNITAVVDVVLHATNSTGSPNRHDVRYNRYLVGTCGSCGDWTDDPAVNETVNNKLPPNAAEKYYSISPAIAVASQGTKLYAVYMEGKEEGGWNVNDAFVFDVIYKGTVELKDQTNRSGVYLPIIVKNSS